MSLPKTLLYRANRPTLHFSPNDPIGSRSTGGHLEISSINNQRTARVFIRFLAYFPEANLSSTSLPSKFWKYSKTFHQHPKIFKDFFACKFVSAANHRQPGNIQRLFRLQIVLAANHQLYPGNIQRLFGQQQSTAATSSSNQQQQSAAAINISNQQQQSTAAISSSNQQQQPAAATSKSNQQQQPAAAFNSSNQHQQSTAAISNNQLSSYQQYLHNPRRPPLVTNTVPSRCYVLLEVDLGLAAR